MSRATRLVGRAGYRGPMAREQDPSEAEVEHDFSVPGDADLRPVPVDDDDEEAGS